MDLGRREFIGAGACAAAAGMCGCLGTSASCPAAAAPVTVLRKARMRSPGERIRMGFIGVGGRGAHNMREFCGLGECVQAICDVDLNHLRAARKWLGDKWPKVRCYQDWRRMLEKEQDLDAVVVSTPDHMHGICAIAAMECGCHVYVEKPLVRTWWEAERFREVARACGVVTQMGNNGNGLDGQRRNVEILQSGVLGDVREIHVTTDRPVWPQGLDRPEGGDTVPPNLDWNLWLGVAPKRPYRRGFYHAFKWRGWFDFGTGALGDIGCHAMSFFWRGLDMRETVSVETVKTTRMFPETYPSATTVKILVRGARQKDPVAVYWHDGNTSPDPEFCLGLTNGRLSRMGGTTIVGSKGVWWNGNVKMNGDGKFVRHQEHPATRDIPQSIPRVKGHHWEFAEAVRGGARPFSDYDHSVPLTETVLLGAISQRVPGRLVWNQAQGCFDGSEAANALLRPHIRHGWTIG